MFVRSFVCLFVSSFVLSFIRSFVRSFIGLFVRSLVYQSTIRKYREKLTTDNLPFFFERLEFSWSGFLENTLKRDIL